MKFANVLFLTAFALPQMARAYPTLNACQAVPPYAQPKCKCTVMTVHDMLRNVCIAIPPRPAECSPCVSGCTDGACNGHGDSTGDMLLAIDAHDGRCSALDTTDLDVEVICTADDGQIDLWWGCAEGHCVDSTGLRWRERPDRCRSAGIGGAPMLICEDECMEIRGRDLSMSICDGELIWCTADRCGDNTFGCQRSEGDDLYTCISTVLDEITRE